MIVSTLAFSYVLFQQKKKITRYSYIRYVCVCVCGLSISTHI